MKINSLAELGEAIKYAKHVNYKHAVSIHQQNLLPGMRGKEPVILAQFDKNEQLCDIQPRDVLEVQSLFNKYKGRPYSLIADELRYEFENMIKEGIV